MSQANYLKFAGTPCMRRSTGRRTTASLRKRIYLSKGRWTYQRPYSQGHKQLVYGLEDRFSKLKIKGAANG